MPIFGRLDAVTGRLTDIRQGAPQYANDVPLDAMPSGFGPFSYDAVSRLAVSSAALAKSDEQDGALAQFLSSTALGRALRGLLVPLLAEINALRQRDRDRAGDVAAATSLADLKTRWAAHSTLADRTLAQAKQAIQDAIASTDTD